MPKRSSQTTKSKNPLADLGDFDFHALWDDINGGGASKEPAAPAKAAPAKAAPAKAAPAKAKRASLGINSSLRTLFGGSADKGPAAAPDPPPSARGDPGARTAAEPAARAAADRRPSLGVSSSVRKLFGAREKAPDAAPRRGSLSSSMKNLFEKRPSAADGRPALKRRGSSMRRRSSMSALLGTDTLHHKSQKAGHLSANLIGEYRAIFAACDTDGNGTLDAEEVKGALSRAGQKCSDAEVQSLIGEVDKNGDGVVDFAEFVRLLAIHDEASHEHQDKVQALATLGEGKLRRQSTRVLSADQVAHYSDLFDSFDIDGNGGIDVQELFHGLRGHRGGVTLADCRRYMAKVPQDDDGCIALPEFLQIIAMQEIVKGGVGNLIVEQTKASLNTQKYLSHAKVLEVEALFARADDDKNGLLEHHELLDALNENARGKKPSKFLNELRFAFATSDRHGHDLQPMDKFEFVDYARGLVGRKRGVTALSEKKKDWLKRQLGEPMTRHETEVAKTAPPQLRHLKLPRHPRDVHWRLVIHELPIVDLNGEHKFDAEVRKIGVDDVARDRTREGNSLLHYVAEVGCEWAMRVLLKHTPIRLVVAERNRHGFSPYALAVLNERDACALLIEPWIAQSLAALSDNTNSHDQRERAIYKANIDMRKSILANGGTLLP